jgi:class 3 adenylate cyclase
VTGTAVAIEVKPLSALERALMHPLSQRVATLFLSTIGLASGIGMAVMLATAPFHPDRAAAPRIMGLIEIAMLAAMCTIGALLGLYLAVKGNRRPLPRLLGCACAGLSAIGIFFAAQVYFESVSPGPSTAREIKSLAIVFVGVLLLSIAAMSIWLFSATKFFMFFPRPVKLLDIDPQESGWRSGGWKWRWLATPQFAALAAGVILVWLLDSSVDRLRSSLWDDASIYLLCWLPFAAISAKQRSLGDEDRRAIRWVLLGQSVWLVLFLLSALGLLASLWLGAVPFPTWTDSNLFVGAFLRAFFAGFMIVLMAGLAISILYDGTLDPDLMIRRTWVLAVVGLVSGSLFVILERVLAGVVAEWLGVSAINALTIIAAATATIIYPARSLIEARVKKVIEGWQASHAIAEGERRQAVILFADLTGYTALTERNEREALIMAAIFHRDAQAVAKARRGHLIKTIGDAVMLRFGEVDHAVGAIRDLKRDYAAHVKAMSMEPLRVHAALHYGEVVLAPSGDVFGATVNLAARLLGAAGTEDIVASRAAMDRTHLAGALFLGERTFKNVEAPVGCFRIPDVEPAA